MRYPAMTTATRLALLFCLSLGLTAQTAQSDHTVSYTYTAQGQVATLDGPRLDVADITTYGYNAQGQRISITNPLGHATQVTAHDAAGRPLTMVSPNGLTTTLSYDARGRLTQQTRGDGTASRTTQYAYDAVGNLTQATQPDGSFLSYEYDPAHRLIGMEDNQGNRIDYTLDAMGNRLSEQVSDPQGVLTRSQSQVYDQLSQLSQQIDSQNHATGYGYDANGNLTQTTDANQQATAQTYDPHDRLRQVTDPLNGTTHYTYDAQHNLTSVTDPNGLSTTYEYDGLGHLISQTSPDTGATSYTVDEAGNRLTQTDARGVTVSYAYDALNRLTAIHYPDPSLDVGYTYDQGTHGIGQLTQMSDAQGSTDYGYNAYGELISQTRTSSDAIVTTFGYAYDTHGRLATLTYPSGKQLHYDYATDGQLTTLTLEQTGGATQSLASNIQRLPFGPIQALDYGNGLSLSRSFDQDYRLISQQLTGVLDNSYTHDPVGNITAWTDLLNTARHQQFGYDALDRLLSASGAYGSLGYSYDATGNRLSMTEGSTTETYSYVPDSHRLQQILGSVTDNRGYDDAGNTVQSLIGSYTYDQTNRLSGYSKPGTQAAYAYNGKGERVSKTVNSVTTRFRYGPEGRLLGEYDATGNPVREYVYLDGQPVAMSSTDATTGAEVLSYLHTDHLGAVVKATDQGQNLVWDATRRPFGERDITTAQIGMPLGFPGQIFDEETGNYYNYFRDYDPSTGRYLQSDPIGLDGGLNTYLYVNANPIRFVDPTGELGYTGAILGGGITSVVVYAIVDCTRQCADRKDKECIATEKEGARPIDKANCINDCIIFLNFLGWNSRTGFAVSAAGG
ncbi:MAG: RHS repeat protein [Candidatus Thiodiazotropha sp. (ex Epidulcina cf. delphinae)]|nr:RHS repeat protein [Candidatus Thiodiazotropha sp. (ex Epidulcina cf. delphinae)]